MSSLVDEDAINKIQAAFRGGRARKLHVARAKDGLPCCPFFRSPSIVVDRIFESCHVTDADVIYDLGCGDGVLSLGIAQRCQARCLGFDIDDVNLATARKLSEAAGFGQRVRFVREDIFAIDFQAATVVVMFLIPNMLVYLSERLKKMCQPGTRIATYHFELIGWEPEAVHTVDHPLHPPPATTSLYTYCI